MIELIPAIDIIEGQCVRLSQGDYNTKKAYGNPVDMAQEFEQLGFRRLHVVDLDGAKNRHVVNLATLREIRRRTRLVVDFGGGVKSTEDMEQVLEAGADLVTVGSVAVTKPELFIEWLQRYGADHIILGADVRHGKVSINGWLEDSTEELTDFLQRYMDAGTRNVLCTEISRDGMLQGPATELYSKVMKAHPSCHLIASGGVSSISDIHQLEEAGIPAVVFGKAIYEGRINLKELLTN
ncbi:MAG: 1-(5-phosphoribosyl)-5-[(5-phosphoribosylamino)methylideneamino]imidazole-4-carboxamide isomerase [Bacteroidaceae bacterium]|nr:1-(5-phosphoribosyl)-5-[(5-phosphoribosylamino)methylideneamino]imidazole-4-carboxamide isomerase [Bacteroidaceae bacterium]